MQPEPEIASHPRAPANLSSPWYRNVSAYQWLILAIASAGWIFDVYEGQIFNITRTQLLTNVLHLPASHRLIQRYGDISLAWFLLGGTAGGLLFGSLADRWGRKPTMALTILTYSVFSGLTFFAQQYWHVALLRFLVAMGVGGEWAVAASLVAEVFPAHARAHASGIFHATSVLGTYAATAAGLAVGSQWRNAYLIGIIPALLVAGVMVWVKEPESWKRAGAKVKAVGGEMGSLKDLLGDALWRKRALLGMTLAAIGLGTFWAITVAGQDLAREMLLRTGATASDALEHSKTAYGYVQTAGGGIGLLAFGPLCVRLGRKRSFTLMLIGAFLIVPITCYLPKTYAQLLILLPVFGFLTLGIHAGFAIYFPELFPTHLRATGAGFCFNVGRALAASILWGSGVLKSLPGMDFRAALCLLALLFLVGAAVVKYLPETKDQPLPE
jgi:MFS family permease